MGTNVASSFMFTATGDLLILIAKGSGSVGSANLEIVNWIDAVAKKHVACSTVSFRADAHPAACHIQVPLVTHCRETARI